MLKVTVKMKRTHALGDDADNHADVVHIKMPVYFDMKYIVQIFLFWTAKFLGIMQMGSTVSHA